ncbi:cholesterol oxidase [Dulcicalothrix desertica PCC 7102]|uniref:Cholesterol oxidase n=1 Tax=Dulcicalothrix desertica PCC 7102 TaxID=232991 RepID=A0A433UHG4_9CYAN|nr:GMC oxidoreductase [Dulcicalothrix desertica]RUS93313.1 cholesterol oxidase [Dulcicalothrix desertica PCC 7102]TWH62772.1 cholesterol oxidase [Dulcicalothrix desertica PCC 7102]
MFRVINRRQFIQTSLLASASIGVSAISASASNKENNVEAIVIGSGFGGAVAALRLAQAGIETIVLERGRRWLITDAGDTFSTGAKPDGRSSWLSSTAVASNNVPIDVYTGVLDIKVGDGINVLRGAGVGGGSLVYNAVIYQPTRENFYKVFPRSINYEELDSTYYPRVRSILKPSPIPDDILQTKYYLAARTFLEQAAKANLKVNKLDINVDWDIVRQEITGQKVPSAIVGEVLYGMNSGAKNSLDKNYLSMAEATGKAKILPLHVVTEIEELNQRRFRVVCNQINEQGTVIAQKSFTCRYLFLAAGSIGTTELLLRAKYNGKLRRLNNNVGMNWGTNGDSILLVATNSGQTNPTQGGPAVGGIEDFDNPIAPVVIEQIPFSSLPEGVYATLAQGITLPEGKLTYNAKTNSTDLFWPKNSANNQKLTQAYQATYQKLNQASGITNSQTLDFSTSVHPLGGATVGSVCNSYMKVKGYANLFVVDGAFIPGSTACVNPSLTIAALAERCMDNFLEEK